MYKFKAGKPGFPTYMVLKSSLYSSSPLFSLMSRSSLSISSLSTKRNEPRAA